MEASIQGDPVPSGEMASEPASNYAQVSIREDDESDELSDTMSYRDHAQSLTREPSVPAIEISPPRSPLLPPNPPARTDTEDTYVSAITQPLSREYVAVVAQGASLMRVKPQIQIPSL